MTALVQRRCQHHADREAVARCPECQRFFCRECISEHDERILCTACLAKLAAPVAQRPRRFVGLSLAVLSVVAVVLIWFCFFVIGQALLAVPAAFHEGKVWQTEETE